MQAYTSDDDEALGMPVAIAAGSDNHSTSTRACEICRTRKTKCDREYPCLQCRRSGAECKYAAVRPKQKRTRILITPQYERKIDLIDDRLGTITKLLKELKTQSPIAETRQEPQYNTPPTARAATTAVSSPDISESATGPGTEGESSLSAHSIFVNEFLQDFVQPDPEIRRNLNELSNIVGESRQESDTGEVSRTNVQSQSQVRQKRNELPPFSKVAPLIRLAKAQRLAGSGWVYEYVTMRSFGDLCLEVFFSDNPTLFDYISVNAGLHSLFWDYASLDEVPETEKEQSIAYSRICQDNLEVGLSELPLQLPSSANVVSTLLFASFYAIGCSKPLQCWTLACKASEICQTLGYHRKSVASNPNPEASRYVQFLFWTTYYIDKTLSLRLGRASTIPDWEISIDLPALPNGDQEPVLAYFVLWIKLARCQGNIYEMLYSPGSMMQSDSVRQSRVDLLRKDLEDLERETENTLKNWDKIAKANSGENLMDFYSTSDAVLRLSLLTHVHRAAPRTHNSPTTFAPHCVEVARATINKHHECMAIIRARNNLYFSTYVHWTLLLAPFVPFIVLFCNVMETRDQHDLALLHSFVASIHSASTISSHAAKMHGLFRVLHNIARHYVTQLGPETDARLAAMGFPHARQYGAVDSLGDVHPQVFGEPSGVAEGGVDPMFWMGNGAELESWLFENQVEGMRDFEFGGT